MAKLEAFFIKVMGLNFYGQLGLGDNINRSVPTLLINFKAKYSKCGLHHTILIDLENNLWGMGSNHFGQLGLGDFNHRNKISLLSSSKVNSISCGKQKCPLRRLPYYYHRFK